MVAFTVCARVLHEAKRKCAPCASPEEGMSGNVKILKEIIEKVKLIGGGDVEQQQQPDKEEEQLMNKIWQNVASAVYFFFAAMTYEQRMFFTEHDILPSSEYFSTILYII
jgi:hypothetical protein